MEGQTDKTGKNVDLEKAFKKVGEFYCACFNVLSSVTVCTQTKILAYLKFMLNQDSPDDNQFFELIVERNLYIDFKVSTDFFIEKTSESKLRDMKLEKIGNFQLGKDDDYTLNDYDNK